MSMPAVVDYSAPFAEAAPDSPWGALTATLRANGILTSNKADLDNEEFEPSTCTTLGELLLPPPSVHSSNNNNNTDDVDAPLLLVLVSGSWCAPCRNFTPVLSSLTPILTSSNITVLFCSACADLPSFTSYYQKMPPNWRALPFEEDGEDDRDDLMECLGAQSLPTLCVVDPLTGKVVVQNAVMEVQAGGREGIGGLIQKWKKMARDGDDGSGDGGAVTAAGGNFKSDVTAGAADANEQTTTADNNDDKDDQNDNDESLTLHYTIPSSPGLICQYFQTQLLSPHLPSALSTIILRRDTADDDIEAINMAQGLRTTQGPGERWLFRTAAPALPVNSWGGSLGIEAGAVECWEIERDGDNTASPDSISRAVVNIENETGRLILVFRETIIMERSTKEGGGCDVTKTLNLDGVPSMAHGPFIRRWRRESEAIFHALLGTCDRKKMMK